jgi:hypothetical protein
LIVIKVARLIGTMLTLLDGEQAATTFDGACPISSRIMSITLMSLLTRDTKALSSSNTANTNKDFAVLYESVASRIMP